MEVIIFIALVVGTVTTHLTMYYMGKLMQQLQSIKDRLYE